MSIAPSAAPTAAPGTPLPFEARHPAPGDGSRVAGIAVGLMAALAFATSGPVVKPLLLAGWSPGGAILMRLAIGAVLLAVPTALALRGRAHLVRAHWRLVVAFGIGGVAAPSALYFLAVDRLPVAVALLVEYTGPLLLVLWSWARTRTMPSRGVLAGASLAMGGLVLVLDLTGAIELDPVGLLFACGAAVGNAAYFALTARPSPIPPVALAGTGMVVGTALVGLLAILGILPAVMPAVEVDLLGAVVPWWIPMLIVGAVPTAVAYGVSVVSVRMLGERVASFLALSEVLFAVALAWLLLAEVPRPVQLVGAVAVVAGVALVRRSADRDAERRLRGELQIAATAGR